MIEKMIRGEGMRFEMPERKRTGNTLPDLRADTPIAFGILGEFRCERRDNILVSARTISNLGGSLLCYFVLNLCLAEYSKGLGIWFG